MFDLNSGTDVLLRANSDYIRRFQEEERASKKEETTDSVYELEGTIDPSLWDVSRQEEYWQTHLIRFEIDRTRYSAKSGNRRSNTIKITDIDLWMNGNRHCVA